MKKYLVYILTLLFCFTACDDNTGSLGGSIIPDQDIISVDTATFWASSKSLAVDSVLGKTNKVYLGRFTDPQTKSMFEADFIAQFNCEEGGQVFPNNILSMRLYILFVAISLLRRTTYRAQLTSSTRLSRLAMTSSHTRTMLVSSLWYMVQWATTTRFRRYTRTLSLSTQI